MQGARWRRCGVSMTVANANSISCGCSLAHSQLQRMTFWMPDTPSQLRSHLLHEGLRAAVIDGRTC